MASALIVIISNKVMRELFFPPGLHSSTNYYKFIAIWTENSRCDMNQLCSKMNMRLTMTNTQQLTR